MRNTKDRFLAFFFADYEGVRTYLDSLGASGWELKGRSGWLTGRLERSVRTELRYDVVPAMPSRQPEELRREVARREEAGWEPVDTFWGMDVYKSMPCREPELFRSADDVRQIRQVFWNRLIWNAAILIVTGGVLLAAAGRTGLTWTKFVASWYLSDSKTALCFALPFLGTAAVLRLIRLCTCLLRQKNLRSPAKRPLLYLWGGLQVLTLAVTATLPVVLLLDAIPRAWIRVTLLLCFCLTPIVGRVIGREDGRKRLTVLSGGVFACLISAMLLGWTVQPVGYDTQSNGNGWRTGDTSLPILRAEELGLDTEGQRISAWYEEDGSLLVGQQHYAELWDTGYLDVQVYTCRVPALTETVWAECTGGAELRFRQENRIYCISGTADWSDDTVRQRAMALAQ